MTGVTVAEAVGVSGLARQESAFAVLGERVVPREAWGRCRPGAGSTLRVGVRPAGSFAFAFLSSSLGSLISNVALQRFAVQTIQDSLVPPDIGDPGGGAKRRSIVGETNQIREYEQVMQVLGEHKVAPDHAARPYSTVEGGKLYYYALFTVGHGPNHLTDAKFGETPIFGEDVAISYTGKMIGSGDFKNDEFEFRKSYDPDAAGNPLTLFSANVQEQQIGVRLTKNRGFVTERTVAGVDGFTVIVGFPNGLIRLSDTSGSPRNRTVRILIGYRNVADGDDAPFTTVQQIQATAKTRNSKHFSRRVEGLAVGTYDVRVKRQQEEGQSSSIIDASHWVSMLTTRPGDVLTVNGLDVIAMRRKIEGQGGRADDVFTVTAKTIANDWTGAAWVEQATKNPASIYRLVLQGAANKRALADAKIDLTALADWHDWCDTNGFTFGHVTRGGGTVFDMLNTVAAAGRAAFAIQDGIYTVVRDIDHTSSAPVQHITPRNSFGFRASKVFPDLPDALKVQFTDPDQDWLDTERIVPRVITTTAQAAIDAAVTFERLDLTGIIDKDHAWKIGRYHLAVMTGRPEEYSVGMDFEHLDLQRGDLVRVVHDVSLHGLHAGRVKTVTLNGSSEVTSVTVDEECVMEAATDYGVRFRKADGSSVVADVTLSIGRQTTLNLPTPIPADSPQVAIGDLFLFGIRDTESVRMIVKSITPTGDLGATVTLVDEAPSVQTAASGTIPPHNPQITIPAVPRPPRPTLLQVRTGRFDRRARTGTIRVTRAGGKGGTVR